MKNNKYYESHIKCDVLNFLRKSRVINSRSTVASEYVLGSTGRRADLALFNGSTFVGIEIKSQHDSLARLKDQLEVYTSCFDEVMLVLDERHISCALDIVSPGVSVFEANRLGAIELRRAATVIPTRTKATCLKLLTMTELRKLTGLSSAPLKKSSLLAHALLMSDEEIDRAIRTSFMQTFSDTSLQFWQNVRRRSITTDALGYLSRFAPERTNIREREEQRSRFWDSWRHDASATFQSLGT